MKKTLLLLLILLTLGLVSVQAQFIHISGYVTDETNGYAVPNHEVYIMDNDSLGIYSVAITNANGYYTDSISTGGMVVNSLYIYTNDLCTFGIHDTVIQNPGPQVTASFEICVDSIPGPECQAVFNYYPDSSNQYMIYFTDASTSNYPIESWLWSFGDGNYSSQQHPVHTFNTFGYHYVCLTINSDSGACTSTFCEYVYIAGGGSNCQALFYDSIVPSNPNTVYFYDESIPSGQIDSWFWDFGDGGTSTQQNPEHTFSDNGLYGVCLTITSDSGSCTSTYCDSIYISGGGIDCEADFYYIQDSTVDLTILFFDMSTPANAITSWDWSFGDGGTSTEQNPVYKYDFAGVYNVCLTIESQSQGAVCYDTYCMDLYVNGSGGFECQAGFYHTTDSNAMTSTVYFWDLSTPVGLIDTWYWDFGDGNSSAQQNPVHTYSNAGTYTVCLTITADSSSCTSVYCDSVVITIEDQYQLGGNVFAGIYQLDQGFAYAYKSENGVITDVYSDFIDTLGYYLFYPLTAADYYVKVEPSPNSSYYGNYMPTYYGDVVTWEDAVMINLSQNIYTADINLAPLNQAAFGPGQISGTIVHGTTLRDNTPAEGVQIMLANEQGEFIGLTYSDEEGKFAFTGLPYGTFTLYAEVVGIGMVPGEFILTQENDMIDNISMIMTDDEIYFGPNSIESLDDITLSEIYPNPVTNTLKLDIGVNNPTSVSVKIVNQVGQVIRTEQISLQQGQTLELNTEGLNTGMYFLEVLTKNNFRTARRFVKF
ncbi:MAG TPA: PKD domain-containing protein [Bacteroidales bacterium]|nr:PKD domain-containing protein [Bacteroidales bacterium]